MLDVKACLVGLAAGALLAGCGQSCDDLGELRVARDAQRSQYLVLAASGASPAETERADERLHALERRVFDLERACR